MVGGEVDVVGADNEGTLYIGSGGNVSIVNNGGESGAVGGAAPVESGGVINSSDIVVEDATGGGANSGGDGNSINAVEVATGNGRGAEGGADISTGVIKGEKEKGGALHMGGETGCGDGVGGGGAGAIVDEGANNGGGVGGGGASGMEDVGATNGGGINVGPIPQIPRSRLREILEHAQGECIMYSVSIMYI